LICLELISEENRPLSALIKSIDKFYRSGEINFRVEDQLQKMKQAEDHFSEGKIDHLDGLTVEFEDWWFNLRPSNTEPLIRLNIESSTPQLLDQKKKELFKLIG